MATPVEPGGTHQRGCAQQQGLTKGRTTDRQWAEPLTTNGQLRDRPRAGSHGRRRQVAAASATIGPLGDLPRVTTAQPTATPPTSPQPWSRDIRKTTERALAHPLLTQPVLAHVCSLFELRADGGGGSGGVKGRPKGERNPERSGGLQRPLTPPLASSHQDTAPAVGCNVTSLTRRWLWLVDVCGRACGLSATSVLWWQSGESEERFEALGCSRPVLLEGFGSGPAGDRT